MDNIKLVNVHRVNGTIITVLRSMTPHAELRVDRCLRFFLETLSSYDMSNKGKTGFSQMIFSL